MGNQRIKKEGQAQLFNSKALEFFTRTNPVIHVLVYGSALAWFFYVNPLPLHSTVLLTAAGIFTWTFMEYIIHRYLFHIRFARFQYLVHGVHHEYPRDKERLLMPPVPGLVILALIFGIFYLPLGESSFAFVAGVVAGYMVYTFVHYIVHTWKPVKGFRYLWTHHHRHHNPQFEHTSYGVSSPFWDYVFGTMPPAVRNKEL
jgi:sterol desaturase/sphingolipid hydroxylase (fatty acid hydroxylase superfamily)